MTYYTVWQFDNGTEDFRCKGVFMSDREAEHCADHNASTDKATGTRKHAPIIVHDDFAHLVEYLTRARIGQLADVLVRLEQQLDGTMANPSPAAPLEQHLDLGASHMERGTFEGKPAIFIVSTGIEPLKSALLFADEAKADAVFAAFTSQPTAEPKQAKPEDDGA